MRSIVIVLVILFALIPGLSWGQSCTHYVSSTGSATWANSTNISTPTSVATAMTNAAAGNVVCFRGGTYTVPAKNSGDTYSGYYSPSNSGTSGSYITFKAYPGETPLFNGTTGGSGDGGHPYATIFGVYRQAYITFDGFSLQANGGTAMARMCIYSDDPSDYSSSTAQPTHHITIKNFTFNGGGVRTASTDNEEGLRIEDTDDITVQNSTFYGYLQTDDWHNTGAIKLYHVDRTTIENCEIYSCSSGIYDKSGSNGNIFRYNYIHSVVNSIYSPCNGYSNINGSVYHNLILNSGSSAISIESDGEGLVTNGWSVYNNTIYDASAGASNPIVRKFGTGVSLYNNIIDAAGSDYGGAQIRTSDCTYTEIDYNEYANHMNVRIEGTAYTSITALRNGTPYGDHDQNNSTSCFTNGSGNLNTINDFLIKAPCVGTGKAGGNIGADVSLVGVSGGGGAAPAPPTDLGVQMIGVSKY